MSPLSDKDLDRLSREAAEQFDVEGSASGWDQLEKKLDRELPVEEKKRRRRFWWFFFLALGLGLATWGIFSEMGNGEEKLETQNSKLEMGTGPEHVAGSDTAGGSKSTINQDNKSKETQPDNNSEASSRDKITKSIPEVSSGDRKTKSIPEISSGETITKNTPEISSSETITKNTPAISSRKKIASRKSGIPSRENITSRIPEISSRESQRGNIPDVTYDQARSKITNTVSPEDAKDKDQAKVSITDIPADTNNTIQPKISISDLPVDTNHTAQPKIPHNDPSKQVNQPSNQIDTSSIPSKALTSETQKSDAAIVSQEIDTTTVSASAKKKINASSKGFEFGILGGIDASTVKFKGMSAPGINLGIVAGFRFNNRWSVNTGLIFTEKKYTAYGDDFNPPKGYWTYYVEMDKVDGVCTMWEIPLNIRYDFSTKASSRWFLSAGASTYLMKKENYEYYYYYNGDYTNRYRSYPSSEKYFLSIINISGGYERSISRKFTLQVEPYIKVPVKGVGFGNINLNSFGTNFLLKFHPGR